MSFFPDEPLIEQDAILNSVKPPHRDALFARRVSTPQGADADSLHLQWDVALLTG